jgi:hypothetical protein
VGRIPDKEPRQHPDLGVEGPVMAFMKLKDTVSKRRPLDEDAYDLYEGLQWLSESLRELHFKVDSLLEK